MKSPSYTYKGNFKNNKFEGLGDIVYSNGESYSGPFKAGKFHGNGVYVAKNGKYVGNFRLGKYHGLGFYEWKDGSTYEGEYHEGSREGLGRFIRGDFSYEGIWKNGKPEKSENIALAGDTKSQIPLTLWSLISTININNIDHMRNKVQDTPLNRPRYLSEKIELVPDQLTKLLYRKGEG